MKKLILASAVMAVAATACTKDNGTQVQTKEIKVVVGNVEAGNESKALFTDREGMSWEETDGQKLGIIAGNDGNWSSCASSSINIQEDRSATFTANVPQDAATAWFYYPYSGSDNGLTHTFSFPETLVQRKAGVSENFKFVSTEGIALEGSTVKPSLQMVGAVVRTVIYSAQGNEEKVQSVKLSAKSANLSSSECVCDLSSGALTPGGSCTSSVKVNLEQKYDLSGKTGKDNASAVYLPVVPANTEGFSIEIATDIAVYTFDSSATKEWADGELYTFYTNLDKGARSISLKPRFSIYHWADWGGYNEETNETTKSVGNSGGEMLTDSYFMLINGVDATAEQRTWVNIVSTGAWCKMEVTETNQYKITYEENTTGEDRSADLIVYFNAPYDTTGIRVDLWGATWDKGQEPLRIFTIHLNQSK